MNKSNKITSFSDLLSAYMRRIRASANGVATEIGMSREAVNNWRNGLSLPNRRHRNRVLASANYLRLTDEETNLLLASAGFEAEFPLAQNLPEALFTDYLDTLLQQLNQQRSISISILLTQASWGEPPLLSALLCRANKCYGEKRVLHLHPPYSLSACSDDYFEALAQQCDFSASNDYQFEQQLSDKLKQSEPLFILVSRFEQGAKAPRETLAGILRSLAEMNSDKLHVLLCGGEGLSELKYLAGDLSLLNIADVALWPEFQTQEVLLLAHFQQPSLQLDDKQLDNIMNVTGGHPGLINYCLNAYREQANLSLQKLRYLILDSSLIWQAVTPLCNNETLCKQLLLFTQKPILGMARPFIIDPLMKRLYWQNLIRHDYQDGKSYLVWRSEIIRKTVQRIADLDLEA